MNKGDIILIPFPFTDLSGNKMRPALVLVSGKVDVTVAFITTQFRWREQNDVSLLPTEINGLKQESLIRLSKLATLDSALVKGILGKVEQNDILEIDRSLKNILKLD